MFIKADKDKSGTI
jgi:Ca2+-binding EF-hand superfamily protein